MVARTSGEYHLSFYFKEERKPSFLFEDVIDLMEAIVLLTQIKKEFMTRIL